MFSLKEIPRCGGYKIWTSYGEDFDCEYKAECFCEDCICNYHNTGGKIDPRTGKKFKRFFIF